MRSLPQRILTLLALPVLLVACDDGTGPSGDAGTVSVMLTDAPGDFAQAVVTISSIYLQGDAGRVVLMDDPVTVDLLTLQNEVLTLVGETPVPGGQYSELRLVISDALVVVEQASGDPRVYATSADFATSQGLTATGDLQAPSFGSSGLKIKIPADLGLVDGDDNAILLDFNVAGSFGHQAGNSGKWVLHPVIHATSFTTTGAIRMGLKLGDGVTLPVIGGTQITMAMLKATLDRNGDIIVADFADTDADGTFHASFLFLPPGTYSVGLQLPAGLGVTTAPVLPHTFTVVSGQTATETFTITARTP